LAAAWARHDYALADAFLQDKENFGINEVLKALTLLDSGRQVRVLEKKMKRLQTSAGKVKPTTTGKLKSDIDNLNKNKPLVSTEVRTKLRESLYRYMYINFRTTGSTSSLEVCLSEPECNLPE